MLRENRQSVALPDPVTDRVEPNGSRGDTAVEAQHVDRRGLVVVDIPVVDVEQTLLDDEDGVPDVMVGRQLG
jgi:hypothetical protein